MSDRCAHGHLWEENTLKKKETRNGVVTYRRICAQCHRDANNLRNKQKREGTWVPKARGPREVCINGHKKGYSGRCKECDSVYNTTKRVKKKRKSGGRVGYFCRKGERAKVKLWCGETVYYPHPPMMIDSNRGVYEELYCQRHEEWTHAEEYVIEKREPRGPRGVPEEYGVIHQVNQPHSARTGRKLQMGTYQTI